MIIYKDNLRTIQTSYEKIIMEFWARWCEPSIKESELVGKLFKKYTNKLVFYRVNIDENNRVAEKFNIKCIPTMVYFKDSIEQGRLVGYKNYSDLTKFLDSASK